MMNDDSSVSQHRQHHNTITSSSAQHPTLISESVKLEKGVIVWWHRIMGKKGKKPAGKVAGSGGKKGGDKSGVSGGVLGVVFAVVVVVTAVVVARGGVGMTGVSGGPLKTATLMANGGNNSADAPPAEVVGFSTSAELSRAIEGYYSKHDLGRYQAESAEGGIQLMIYRGDGKPIRSLDDIADDGSTRLYVVPTNEFFFWPGLYIGHKQEVYGVTDVDGNPLVLETVSLEPRVFVMENIVDQEIIDQVYGSVKEEMQRSTMYTPTDDGDAYHELSNARTSAQAWYNGNHPKTNELYAKMESLTKVPAFLSQGMQVIEYGPNQHYEGHLDSFPPENYPNQPDFKNGRNRLITVLFYLNDVEEGGQTCFMRGDDFYGRDGVIHDYGDCTHGPAVFPKTGRAVMFYNLEALGHMQGKIDTLSLHSGCDVIKGRKLAMNRWIWNKPYDPNAK